LAVEDDFGAGVLAEENAVALFNLRFDDFTIFLLARADRDHLPLLGLFLGGIGDDDPAACAFFLGDALDDHPVVERPHCHDVVPPSIDWIAVDSAPRRCGTNQCVSDGSGPLSTAALSVKM